MRWLALVLAVALGFVVLLPHLDLASTVAPLCAESEAQAEKVRALAREGLDKAFVESTTHLFRVAVSGGVQREGRATEGINNTTAGYLHAQRFIAEWKIPICK